MKPRHLNAAQRQSAFPRCVPHCIKAVIRPTRSFCYAVVAAAMIAAAPLYEATPATDTAASAQYLQDAVDHLKKGDVRTAVIQLRNAIQANPDNLDARFLLGQLYLQQGDAASAEKELARVHSAKPTDEVEILLGQALLAQQKYEAVLTTVGEEAATPKAKSDKLIIRGNAALGLNRLDDAAAQFEKAAAAQPNTTGVLLAFARLQFARGQVDKAEQQLDAALKIDPKFFDAWLLKSTIATMRGDIRSALADLDQAEAIRSSDLRIALGRAQAHLRGGDVDAAEKLVKDILARNPDNVFAHYLECVIAVARGDFPGASRLFLAIEDKVKDYPPSLLLGGIIKYQTGQFAQAELSFARYVTLVPGASEARRLLALTQLRRGDSAAAIDTLQALLAREPDNAGALHLLASAHLRAGDYAKAAEVFERAAKVGNEASRQQARSSLALLGPALGLKDAPQPLLEDDKVAKGTLLIMEYLKTGEFDAALQKVQELQSAGSNPLIENLAGGVYLAKGDDAAARQHFEAALALDPKFLPAMVNLDRLDIRSGNVAKVEQRLRDRLTASPADERSVLDLANLLIQQRRADEAVALMQERTKDLSSSVEVPKLLARTQLATGHKDEAAKTAEALAARGPDDMTVQRFAAQIIVEAGDAARAVELMQSAVQRAPTDVAARLALAQLLMLAARQQEAETVLNDIRRTNPENTDAVRALINIALTQEQSDRALGYADSLAPTDPVAAATLKGDVLLRTKRPQEAVASLSEAFEKNPVSALAIGLAVAHNQAGQPDQAIADLRQWLGNNAGDLAARRLLAETLIGKGSYAAAAAEYEELMKRNPYDAVTLNNLAWLQSELGSAQAVPLARRAYVLAPKSPEIADTLGWLLVTEKSGADEGLKLLREAAAALPANQDVQYHLAFALNESGDSAGALEILQRILADSAPFHERASAEALLTKLKG